MRKNHRKIRSWVAGLSLIACALSVFPDIACAMTSLKQIQVSNGSQIDLLFDGKISKNQVRTDFFNDVIQISLNDVSVYPARISSINGGSLVKIFAYQYAPKLVRCRLSVKGRAKDFKSRLQITARGKVLSFRLAPSAVSTDRISSQASEPVRASSHPVVVAKAGARKTSSAEKAAEAALLKKVISSSASRPAAAHRSKHHQSPHGSSKETLAKSRSSDHQADPLHLGGGKPLPSPLSVIGKLLAVIGLFGALAFAARKLLSGRSGGRREIGARLARGEGGWMSALGGMAKNAAAGLGRREKMIEVISNHHLGPKKSIAVVRVMGRTLVLGVTNESINLISQISDEAAEMDLEEIFGSSDESLGKGRATPEPAVPNTRKSAGFTAKTNPLPGSGWGAESAAGADDSGFSAMLNSEARKPAAPGGVRSQIRSRLEGLKQL